MHTTGVHRAPRRAPRSVAQRPPERYEPYLDGLFTYCLSVLCDHDAAIEVLGDVLSLSERQFGRCPSAEGERKAWLYALARWACLRKLTEQRTSRQGAHVKGPAPVADATPSASDPAVAPETAERRRRELAMLAWPEAAGTTPEQREILELAVRHQLGPRDVAAVLSMELMAARELLASAACEVERTRAALAVVESGNCPSVARLTGDSQVLLSATLRRELVRHVDDCPRCRRAAEHVEASGPWPGAGTAAAGASRATTPRAPAVLPFVEAPRAAAYTAMIHAPRARGTAPRFGRNGFPMDPKDRAARRDRLRARAVTTTVVATVVAAPVLALWAAYRSAPQTGEGHNGASISAGGQDGPGRVDGQPYDRFENAGNASPGSRFTAGSRSPDVSVEVISDGTSVPPTGTGRPGAGAGGLAVSASSSGDVTTITLRATGGAPVTWAATTGANWLRLSRNSGTLAPGRSVTIQAVVDHTREPAGPWTARIALYPTGSVVRIDGYGALPPSSDQPGTPGGSGKPGHPGKPGHHGGGGHGGHGGHGGNGGHPGGGQGGGGHHGGNPGHPGPGRPTRPGSPDPGSSAPTDPGSSGPTAPTDPTPPASTTPEPPDPPPADPSGGSGQQPAKTG